MSDLDKLRAEVETLRKTVERLASSEAFTYARNLTERDDELVARMNYAKEALERCAATDDLVDGQTTKVVWVSRWGPVMFGRIDALDGTWKGQNGTSLCGFVNLSFRYNGRFVFGLGFIYQPKMYTLSISRMVVRP
jgi:hypothetical protein